MTDHLNQPPRLYAADPLVWAGAYPHHDASTSSGIADTLGWLVAHDVRLIINLTTPEDPLPDLRDFVAQWPALTYMRFPIRDMSTPSAPLMLAILDAISTAVAAGQRVYVHCWGGVGRTGTVIGCWYVRQGLSAEAALARIAQLRAHIPGSSPETAEQVAMIQSWREPSADVATQMRERRQRYRGALLGLAVGDAVGTTLEFESWPVRHPISDMIGGGPFNLAAGQWTDDTSMALCLAESLILQRGFDAHDQLQRYVRWWREGYHSAKSYCFDIGMTTARALEHFEETNAVSANTTAPNMAGNGSLMRLVPVVMAFADDVAATERYARESSQTTHATRVAVEACQGYALMLRAALLGAPVEAVMQAAHDRLPDLHVELAEVFAGSYQQRQPPVIQGSGYAVKSLEAALWAVYHHPNDYRGAMLAAANLGHDADTTAAIAGQLAGALVGEAGIPQEWRDRLYQHDLFVWYAEELLRVALRHEEQR